MDMYTFLLWLKSTTTKYLELPSAKGEEGSRDGDAERATSTWVKSGHSNHGGINEQCSLSLSLSSMFSETRHCIKSWAKAEAKRRSYSKWNFNRMISQTKPNYWVSPIYSRWLKSHEVQVDTELKVPATRSNKDEIPLELTNHDPVHLSMHELSWI